MWWKDAVFYEIYVPAFRDSTGRGIGDLRGITQEIPYLADLGVDALWLTPVYASPMDDNGYDISDYYGVNPLFGTMEDMTELIGEAQSRGIRVVLDMVLNHTSLEHPWFQQSCSADPGEAADWYIWSREPGNNWESFFGGSAWQWNEARKAYFYHSFSPSMADLNWENPQVREMMYAVLRFWLDLGVDGFRLDVINHLKAGNPWQRNNPVSASGEQIHRYDCDAPGIPKILREIRDLCEDYGDILLLGEVGSEQPEVLARYQRDTALDLVFGFHTGSIKTLSPQRLSAALEESCRCFSAPWEQTTSHFTTHDMGRLASRMRPAGGVMLRGLLSALVFGPGIPLLYQGDELGLEDYRPKTISQIFDVQALGHFHHGINQGQPEEQAFARALEKCRDGSRMLLYGSHPPGTGQESVRTLVPPGDGTVESLRKEQQEDPSSVYTWVASLLQLRRMAVETSSDAPDGFEIRTGESHVWIFTRTIHGTKITTAVNAGDRAVELGTPMAGDVVLNYRFLGDARELPDGGVSKARGVHQGLDILEGQSVAVLIASRDTLSEGTGSRPLIT
ncbi:alpha-amylase family glycosyl hydrolase [Spirochaeta lutea]|uniref:alpha-amylase family glycosyl hydrolase n=1 Tax=Spirochaeta lutea TaxID=1480694 RepID=UPI00068BDF6A|nr:alpha-amylase family glycosyl hydrolase [Spirochaeta lutea]